MFTYSANITDGATQTSLLWSTLPPIIEVHVHTNHKPVRADYVYSVRENMQSCFSTVYQL